MTAILQSVLGTTLAQSNSTGGDGVFGVVVLLIQLAIVVLVIASLWKIFVKAGHPGWAAIIPIYNIFIMLKIAGRPWWWLLLMFIPIVGLVIAIMVSVDLAKSFGKGVLFGIGLALLAFIFYPILAFGDAEYQGPATA